jgi:hypothetical protein
MSFDHVREAVQELLSQSQHSAEHVFQSLTDNLGGISSGVDDQINLNLQKLFEALDKNGDGVLQYEVPSPSK